VAAAVERAIHALDKDLSVVSIRSMERLLSRSMAQRRLTLAPNRSVDLYENRVRADARRVIRLLHSGAASDEG
jgi:hypothetical protein